MGKTGRLNLDLPPKVHQDLQDMADDLGLSKNALLTMAAATLVANYKAKGTFIFVDLLNPEHRNKRR